MSVVTRLHGLVSSLQKNDIDIYIDMIQYRYIRNEVSVPVSAYHGFKLQTCK